LQSESSSVSSDGSSENTTVDKNNEEPETIDESDNEPDALVLTASTQSLQSETSNSSVYDTDNTGGPPNLFRDKVDETGAATLLAMTKRQEYC